MLFQIHDVIPPVEGVDLGGDWNGWRCPAFTKESADAIVKAHNAFHGTFRGVNAAENGPEEHPCARFDAETGMYRFYFPDSDTTDDFGPLQRGTGVVWAIGAGCWCWEAAPTTDCGPDGSEVQP